MTDALAVAERALATAPPGETLVRVVAERSLLLRFARSHPTQTTAIDDLTVEVAVLRDGRIGIAETNATDADALADCGLRAATAAEATARGGAGHYPGFPAPGTPSVGAGDHDGHDAETARLDPALGGAALAAAFEGCAARGVDAYGVWTAAETATAVASSRGVAALDRVTDAFMKVTAIAPSGRSGYASATAVAASDLEPATIADRAAAKAVVPGEPLRLAPGAYTVVLAPDAASEVVAWVGALAFDGLAFCEGRSALSDRLGTRVAAARVNLADSPSHPRTLPRAFDAEGTPKRPLPLIQDGVAHRVVHDTRSATLCDAETTGHALAPGGAPHGPAPTNLVLAGGGAADEEQLCESVEHGIYVTRLWYANAVRPKETLVTAMTRDGTFLIEGGRITRPVEDMRMTDSMLGVLDRCEDLMARPALTTEGEFYGRRFAYGVVAPALRASGVRFTG